MNCHEDIYMTLAHAQPSAFHQLNLHSHILNFEHVLKQSMNTIAAEPPNMTPIINPIILLPQSIILRPQFGQ